MYRRGSFRPPPPRASHMLLTAGETALRPDCWQWCDEVGWELGSGGGVQPAERQMDLLYTVHRTINLRNHANNCDAECTSPQISPTGPQLRSPFCFFLSIFLVSVEAFFLPGNIPAPQPELGSHCWLAFHSPFYPPLPSFPALFSQSDQPNWILGRHDCLIVCPVPNTGPASHMTGAKEQNKPAPCAFFLRKGIGSSKEGWLHYIPWHSVDLAKLIHLGFSHDHSFIFFSLIQQLQCFVFKALCYAFGIQK